LLQHLSTFVINQGELLCKNSTFFSINPVKMDVTQVDEVDYTEKWTELVVLERRMFSRCILERMTHHFDQDNC
jgi:hypothetical protein